MNTSPQPTLPFDAPLPAIRKGKRHQKHRVTTASALTFDDAKQHQNKYFLMVLRLLVEFDSLNPQELLTARQMLKIFKSRGLIEPDAERNRISPRLSELLALGCIENAVTFDDDGEEQFFLKRAEGNAAAFVWRITDRVHELLLCLRENHKEVRRLKQQPLLNAKTFRHCLKMFPLNCKAKNNGSCGNFRSARGT